VNGPRLFDAAVEEPDLLVADRTARAARSRGGSSTSAGRGGRRRAQTAPTRGKHRAGATGGHPRPREAEVRTGAMIDPRIAARRERVAAEAAAATPRRGRRLAACTVILVVVLSAAALVALSPVAGVRSVEVGGAGRTGSAAVRAASGLDDRPPLLRVDVGRIAARVEALPWVGTARVERRWPRTVAITVEERRPAAVAPCRAPGEWCLVDATGRVLGPTSDDSKAAAGLPRIGEVPAAGRPGESVPQAARGPLAVAVALPEALRPLVSLVTAEGNEVALNLVAPGRQASPPVVRLGLPERIPEKLTAAATVLARTSVNGVGVLDVRVPESPALIRARR
jgi:cell division protein FtsQ